MERRPALNSIEAVAMRLRGIREATGLSQVEFARRAKIAYTSWNNYERGESLISIVSARKLRAYTGAPLDYIYEGDCSRLPRHLDEKLDEYGWRKAS